MNVAGMHSAKLSLLFDRKQCSLKLLGREISSGDLATGLAAIALIQVFALLGLDWLVDL